MLTSLSRPEQDVLAGILSGLASPTPTADGMYPSEAIKRLAGKTLLLTGAAGFLGQWIVRTIAALNRSGLDCRLIAVDAVSTGGDFLRPFLQRPEDFVYHDLSTPITLGDRIDFAVHAAGIASPYWYKKHPLETISAAVDGSRHVLKLLTEPQNKGARYLFFSSSEVYADPQPGAVPTGEHYVGAIPTMSDRSCYDVSKALGETFAYVYSLRYGVNTGVVRIHNSFGPGMREGDHRILPRIASAMKGGRPVDVYRSPGVEPTRTYCPVANTVAGCLRALVLGKPGEVYNIGAPGPELSVHDLCRRIEQVTGREVPVRFTDPPPVYLSEPRRRCPDVRKAERELGYRLEVDLDEGLRQFFAWADSTYTGATP